MQNYSFRTWDTKLILELASLLEDLHAMIVGICDNNVLIHSQAEAVGGVELSLAWTQLAKLASADKLHINSNIQTLHLPYSF